MAFKLEITVNSHHPVESMEILNDMIHFVNHISSEFSSNNFIDKCDVPLIVDYQHEYNRSFFKDTSIPSRFVLFKSDEPIINIDKPNNMFKLGDDAIHIITGNKYKIVASAYYHIRRSWSHLCYDENKLSYDHVVYPASDLITQHLFDQMPTMLYNITGKLWTWNNTTNIFECYKSPSRKMRPIDVLNNWIMDFENKQVPF